MVLHDLPTNKHMSCTIPKNAIAGAPPIAKRIKKKKFTQFQIEIKPLLCVCVGVWVWEREFLFSAVCLFVCCSLNFLTTKIIIRKKKGFPYFFFFSFFVLLSFIYTVLLPILYPFFSIINNYFQSDPTSITITSFSFTSDYPYFKLNNNDVLHSSSNQRHRH